MNLLRSYRQWQEDWPEAARLAVPIWIGCAVAAGWGGLSIYRARTAAPVVATPVVAVSRPSWESQAGETAKMFPADAQLWRQAAILLEDSDRSAAHRLTALAAQVAPQTAAYGAEREAQLRRLMAGFQSPTEAVRLGAECSQNGERAADYVGCLLIQNRWSEAVTWVDALPGAVAGSARLRELKVEALCRLGSWDKIRQELAAGAWGHAQPDAVNLALSACIAAERGRKELRRELWQSALDCCQTDAGAHQVVLRIALAFGLDEEAAGSFRALAQCDPSNRAIRPQYQIWSRFHPAGSNVFPKV